jgi:citrate lyase synthetase
VACKVLPIDLLDHLAKHSCVNRFVATGATVASMLTCIAAFRVLRGAAQQMMQVTKFRELCGLRHFQLVEKHLFIVVEFGQFFLN